MARHRHSSDTGLLRSPEDGKAREQVGAVELFFDLVFVFAITQLSHGLLAHLTPTGFAETTMLLLVMWWVWVFTAWWTNWLDVERMAVRLMLFVMMALGLLMSLSIPQAFGERGTVFVAALLALQVGRTGFMLIALRGRNAESYRNFQRILIWVLFSVPFWIAGALSAHDMRLWFWLVALAIDYASAALSFPVPGMGRSTTASWDISGHHLAERCGLFVIIALGESILITGATFGSVPWSAGAVAGFASAFLAAVAMWWIYFNIGAERGSDRIAHHQDPGQMARLAYTYLHIPIVAGIIATAAADELVLAHPGGHAEPLAIALILGGPALYLAGNIAFKRTTAIHMPLSHLIGLGLLAVIAVAGRDWAPVALSIATTAVLILVAVQETLSFNGRDASPS